MNSSFEQLEELLKDHKCKNCYGSGKVDDAEPGDTWFNVYACEVCNGSGIVNKNRLLEKLTLKIKGA